ncbi:FKBP-type peptidyl-prolyl cis-trans isomerase [Thermodesulfatator autotrophicus]|uniref:FKBP-type peptidyl-prolyl cis-trans isomerase n=1 Tax=Thermodesulfatator autotrophicus TaxID=1795632 RepID=UPI000839400E|nr:FKBP-type peptidyl-prolyl cis-trans isomerase [Thermodesulfatator autotrophicus]
MDKKDSLVIEPGDEILVNYRVLADKEVVDSSKEPIVLKVGEGKFMPAVEEALVGHRTGERVIVLVSPEEHYGKYDPKKLQIIPAEKLPEGINPGSLVKIQDEYGVVHPAILKKVEEGLAVVDFNHPLAGKTLRFEVDILGIKKRDSDAQGQEEARREQ